MRRGWASLAIMCACGRIHFGGHAPDDASGSGDDATPIDGPADAPLGGIGVDVGTGPVALAVGDFDGDGRIDIVAANSAAGTISVVRNLGNRTFAPAVDFSVGTMPVAVVVADLNKDGKPDIAVANAGSDNASVLLNVGGTFGNTVNFATSMG